MSNVKMDDRQSVSGTSEAFGHEVWAGFFTPSFGQTRTITLIWKVSGVAKKSANGWHYEYGIQRQAGAQWMLHLQIVLQSCAVMTNKWGGLLSQTQHIATLNPSLREEMSLGMDYKGKRP